jgi:DNA-binding GntR family transcriptional regulator
MAGAGRRLSVALTDADGAWAGFLGGRQFVRISRIISVNLEFTTFAELYLPAERFGTFLDYKPRQLDGASVTHLLADQFNAPALRIAQRFGIGAIPDDAAERIGVPAGTIGIEWEHRAYTYRATPLYYQRVYVPPNRRKIEIWDLKESAPAPGREAV